MNKARRKSVQELQNRICNLMSEVEGLVSDAECIRDEEQDTLDCFPENLQGSSRYEAAEEALSHLEDAVDRLSEALDALNEADTELEEAKA